MALNTCVTADQKQRRRLLFYNRLAFFIWLLLGLFDFLFWYIDGKQRTKSYEKLSKEIDELLKKE